nr:MAG TPA: hypothetical protein [Bacteriophage sp.]
MVESILSSQLILHQFPRETIMILPNKYKEV